MYCSNAITFDMTGFLTVDEFDQLVKNRAQEERCGYVEAALLTAWDYMASLGESIQDPLAEAHKVCIGAAITKWKTNNNRWYNGVKQLTTQFMKWGYRYG